VIDSRDLSRLVVRLLADDRPGAFHAVGPAEPTTLAGLITTCAQVAGSQVAWLSGPNRTATATVELLQSRDRHLADATRDPRCDPAPQPPHVPRPARFAA
jgi:2'-hydroxyisoflavone reductase